MIDQYMVRTMTRTLGAKVDDHTYDRFLDKCKECGKGLSVLLRKLVDDEITDANKPQPRPKPEVVEVKKIAYPSYLPAYYCNNIECSKRHPNASLHANRDHKQVVSGRCWNCDQFAERDSGPCAWCADGDVTPISTEELRELSFRFPPRPKVEATKELEVCSDSECSAQKCSDFTCSMTKCPSSNCCTHEPSL